MKSQRRQSLSAAVPFHLFALTAHLLDHALLKSVSEDGRTVSIQAIIKLMTSTVTGCRKTLLSRPVPSHSGRSLPLPTPCTWPTSCTVHCWLSCTARGPCPRTWHRSEASWWSMHTFRHCLALNLSFLLLVPRVFTVLCSIFSSKHPMSEVTAHISWFQPVSQIL